MGHRPRVQIIQGDADQTISFKNSAEGIKQWTNVLALSTAPASTDMLKTSISTYTRQFWKNACGYTVFETWAGKGGSHSMGYEEDDILKFFGLNVAGGADPEPDCPAGGTGTGTAGASGMAGGAGATSSGTGGTAGASVGGLAGSPSASGAPGAVAGSGGTGNSGTVGASGASTGVAGSVASGGSVVGGGVSGAPTSHSAGSAATVSGPDSGGCAFVASPSKSKHTYGALALGLALLAFRRRRSSAQR
jgi:MYXO-CTERM domain-containing protein